MTRRLLSSFCLLMALCATCILSPGDAWSASVAGLRATANKHYQTGKKFAIKKRFDEANQNFFKALALLRKAQEQAKDAMLKARLQRSITTILFFIGRTYQLAKKTALARRYYKECLQEGPPPKVELQTRRYMQALPPEPKPLGQMVLLQINAVPLHASLSLHNSRGEGRFGRVPFKARVKAGIYQLEVTAAGFAGHKETLRLLPGTRVMRNVRLERKGRLPKRRSQPKVALARKPPKPAKPGALRMPLLFACVALGGTAVVVGLSLMAASGGILSEATTMQNEQIGPPSSQQTRKFYEIVDNGGTLQGAGAAMFVVAGFAGAGALILWLWRPPKPKNSAPAQPNGASSSSVEFLSRIQ